MELDNKTKRVVILLGMIILVLQVVVITITNNRLWVLLLLILMDCLFLYKWMESQKNLRYSQEEIVKRTNQTAEKSLDFVAQEMPVGIIVWRDENQVEWINPYAQDRISSLDKQKQFVQQVQTNAKAKHNIIAWDNATYQVYLNSEKKIIYFNDITKVMLLTRKEEQNQTAIGILSIDNYDDATDQMDDKEISYLNSFVTTVVSDWMEEYGVFYKRINAERFLFVARLEDIQKMSKKRFDLLDQLRSEAEKNGMPITISMGVSYGKDTLEKIGDYAQVNLDIALVRGGDQVVLKEAEEEAKPIYFGGKSNSTNKRTRVRSRAMSTALTSIFTQTGDVYIMGHRYPDMDAFGAAFGIACLARFHGKNAWIVINEKEIIPDIERCLQEIYMDTDLSQILISVEKAKQSMQADDLLMMVDYHKPSLSISQELYNCFSRIVIIDHHRRGDEFPVNPMLTYIESSASSTSELVTELIQYQSTNTKKLRKMEATLLLAGIVVDTKSFTVRTSSKTFDAASYLRTCGADSSLVQYLLSSDLSNYIEISQLIFRSEYVTSDIIVVAADENHQYNSVTAAKTADTLLSMSGINAAFVITSRTDGLIGISARSSGTINVQVIMESLGGGGHYTNAATQLNNISIQEAREELLKVINDNINQMYQEE